VALGLRTSRYFSTFQTRKVAVVRYFQALLARGAEEILAHARASGTGGIRGAVAATAAAAVFSADLSVAIGSALGANAVAAVGVSTAGPAASAATVVAAFSALASGQAVKANALCAAKCIVHGSFL